MDPQIKTYVVEHLDPELGQWSELEYHAIAEESKTAGSAFFLTGVPVALQVPERLREFSSLTIENRGVEEIFARKKERVCLLDPSAQKELSPEDAGVFDIFVFGGILGDDPPRDRTSILRQKGFHGRRLGPVQMTTDTAVRVTRMVIQQQSALDAISFVDFPELRIDEHESTEMPFRYVKDSGGRPIMPAGMVDIIKQDADKGIDDLF